MLVFMCNRPKYDEFYVKTSWAPIPIYEVENKNETPEAPGDSCFRDPIIAFS